MTNLDFATFFIWISIFIVVMLQLFRSIRIVPQRFAAIVERLGKYHVTLKSGFHVLFPFIDKVTYVLDLKEETVDVPPQECFTSDEIKVIVDGIIYLSVIEPTKAAYGVTNYKWASMQLAQTTTRSVLGQIVLDKTFEEREYISRKVVEVLEQTSKEWGIRVHRYEIKNITPPESVKNAMEKEVRAERERRAILTKSEGDKQARINRSEGLKQELINTSEGEKQKRINEAQGIAQEIRAIAKASAESIRKVASAIALPGGDSSLNLQLSQKYLAELEKVEDAQIVMPVNLNDWRSTIQSFQLQDTH